VPSDSFFRLKRGALRSEALRGIASEVLPDRSRFHHLTMSHMANITTTTILCKDALHELVVVVILPQRRRQLLVFPARTPEARAQREGGEIPTRDAGEHRYEADAVGRDAREWTAERRSRELLGVREELNRRWWRRRRQSRGTTSITHIFCVRVVALRVCRRTTIIVKTDAAHYRSERRGALRGALRTSRTCKPLPLAASRGSLHRPESRAEAHGINRSGGLAAVVVPSFRCLRNLRGCCTCCTAAAGGA
jgi:hypothetical protein